MTKGDLVGTIRPMDIRDNLNSEQKAAVEHTDGPLLIIAGAGTGKTTVIAQRIAWLIEQKLAQPNEILALTFTDKAAEEMEERIDRLLPYGYTDLWVSTFHAFGERILRDHAIDIGLDARFKVISGADQWLLLREHLAELELEYYRPLGRPTSFLHALLSHFSKLKDEDITPQKYLEYATKLNAKKLSGEEKEEAERIHEAARAYQHYERLLRTSGHLDFGDLIIQTLRLFTERQTVLKKFQEQFKYVLVDEFQDTNMAQYDLVRLLAAPRNNIAVCGDDDQSIYKFRGAAVSNILEFKRDFPEAKEVVLTQNYRSTQPILDMAHSFIQLNNPNRLEARMKSADGLSGPINKQLLSQTKEKGTIELINAVTADDEIKEIISRITAIREKTGDSWDKFAILIRANSQATEFMVHLNNHSIPYQFVSARGLFQKPEILDLIAYLKLLDNYHESPSVYRVLTMPIFGVPMTDIINLNQEAKRKGLSLFETLKEQRQLSLTPSSQAIEQLLKHVETHSELARTQSAGQVLYRFMQDTNLIDELQKKNEYEKVLNISKFYKYILEYDRTHDDHTVTAFVRELELLMDMGEDPAPAALEEGPEAVRIMTVHGAKGLEFEHVFIPQLVDRRFPSDERSEQIAIPDPLVREVMLEGDMHLEEERRLFYVAVTRARRGLYLSWARDMGGKRSKKPSRFLHETGLIQKPKKGDKKAQAELGLGFVAPNTEALRQAQGFGHLTGDKLPIPERFSFTQLQSFERCPKQYKYAHILKIPTDANPQFTFGRSVHNTLKSFYDRVTDSGAPTLKDLLSLYDKHWISEWYQSKDEEQRRKDAGRKALEKFYADNTGSFRKPKLLEKGFTIKVGEYSLRGQIDRIDSLGEKDVEIIDYKTGKTPANKRDIDVDQLLIYAIAAKEVFNDHPIKLTFYYLESGEQKSFSFEEDEIAAVKDKLLTTIEKIKRSDFAATPSKFVCGSCEFRFICEDRVA